MSHFPTIRSPRGITTSRKSVSTTGLCLTSCIDLLCHGARRGCETSYFPVLILYTHREDMKCPTSQCSFPKHMLDVRYLTSQYSFPTHTGWMCDVLLPSVYSLHTGWMRYVLLTTVHGVGAECLTDYSTRGGSWRAY